MITRQSEMRVEMRDRVRGGEGTLRFQHLLEPAACLGKVKLCGVLTIEPGQSIGIHPHGPDAEIYYLLQGRLAATDDGVETWLEAGDAMFTGNGATHSVRNESGQAALLMAVVLA